MNNDFDSFFSDEEKTEEMIEVLDVEEKPPVETPKVETKEKKKFSLDLKNDKVLLVQVILLSTWLLLTVLIYFFGYNLFEPFINV